MRCTYCGSQDLLHDYIHGCVVCSNCGTVNDYIFIEHFTPIKDDEIFKFRGLPTIREGFEKKMARGRLQQLAKASRDVRIYESFAKKRRRDVYVDWDALQKRLQGGKSRVYRHVAEDAIRRKVDTDRFIKIIIERIIDADPVLSSRTLRGKAALAIILKHLILDNDIDMNRIAMETSLSRMHIKRLLTLVKTRMRFINRRIAEVRSAVLGPIPISQ
ncbi:MAG: TFIIB-type zinc ribbon-containing protein [Ignisphaera sp.]|nr:TFIIB-type zinc ribbon-containing protein [Ignisphaera sp.]MCX8168002.1 TFIIB-type zinc ribbon-containing protein [Ignisphaera sp.]MDW8085527.1 TFIIB-type zinc ribbon-containing protein [Ignisphaera sp.]